MIKWNSIGQKVLYNNLIITLIPLTIIMTFISYFICMGYKQETIHNAQNQMLEYANKVKTTIENSIQRSESVLTYSYIINNLDSHFTNYAEILIFCKNTEVYLDNITNGSAAHSIIIYFTNEKLFENKYLLKLNRLDNLEAIKEQFKAVATNLIWDADMKKNENGYNYFQFYREMKLNKGSILVSRVYIPELPAKVQIVKKDNEKFVGNRFVSVDINNSHKAIMELDYKSLHKKYLKTILIVLGISVILIFAIILLTYKTTDRVTSNISVFIMSLGTEHIWESEVDLLSNSKEVVELKMIKESISSLISKIKEMSDSQYRVELEKRELELSLLQSQIDPHTLYNSLSALRYSAFLLKANKMIYLIDNMVSYYRTILNKGKHMVAIKDEMDMIKKYVTINELSHNKKYNLQVDISESLNTCQILHLFLQPFVENAIIHGLVGGKRDCEIKITCTSEEEYLIITICDNGYGMDSEKLEILNHLDNYDNGYGIKNAYLRMKLAYGDDSKINYISELDKGTTVTIKFREIKL